jgi:O-antigen ligase
MRFVTGRWFILFVLLAALVPLGAQAEPALNAVILLVSAAFVVYTIREISALGWSATAQKLLTGAPALAVVALPLYVALQLVVHAALGSSDGPIFAIEQSTMEVTAIALFYLIVRAAASDARSVSGLITILALVGGAEALYGLVNLLAGNERIVLWERTAFHNSATGTLVSRNHFAFLMELLLPVSLAFAAMLRHSSRYEEEKPRAALIGMLAVICALGLLFSHSRMGILSLALSATAVFAVDRAVRPDESGARTEGFRWNLLGVGGVAAAVALAAAIGLDSVLERFVDIESDLVSGRLPIWQAALAMFFDYPLIGSGWGTFRALLPSYRFEPNGFYYTHAHNDYLEILAEGGIIGFAIAAVLVFLFFRRLVATFSMPLHAKQRSVVFWLGVALVAVLIHSLADFGMRATGVAFTFAAVAALFSRVSEEPSLIPVRVRRRPKTAEEM